MENYKIESRDLKLCNDFRAVNRCMKAAFYRQDYQKFLICPLIKRFVRAFYFLKRSSELLRVLEKIKSSAECLNTVHTVLISHGSLHFLNFIVYVCVKQKLSFKKIDLYFTFFLFSLQGHFLQY